MTGSASAGVRRRTHPGTYLLVLVAGAVLTLVVLQLFPDWTVGPVPGVMVVVVGYLAIAVAAWAREPRGSRAAGPLLWFLMAYLLLWIYLMVLLVVRQEQVSITVLVTPVLIMLVWLRPPSRANATWVADGLAMALVVASALTLVVEAGGWVDSWYGPSGSDLAAMERGFYWVPLAGPLGLDGRWAGPFIHPNLAGPVGGVLLVYGLSRPAWRRVGFAAGGVLILLLAGSRTAMVAALSGVVVLVVVWWLSRATRLHRWAKVTIAVLPVIALVAALVIANPGLTGRTSVWPEMTAMWRGSLLLGVGDAGFETAIAQERLPIWADHAHNVFFDAGVRTGVVGLLLVLLLVVLALVITGRGVRYGRGVGLALAVTLTVGSLADTILHWRFVEVTTAALLLAVLMSADAPDTVSERDPSEQVPPPAPAQVRGTGPDPDPAPTP